MATEKLIIEVTEKGAKQTAANIQKVGTTAKQSVPSINLLQRALALIGGAAIIRGFVGMLDVIADLKNRLGLVTTGAAQTGVVMKELFDISNETRTSFEATGLIFTRTALSTQKLGISLQRTLGFTQSLNKAVILSGVNAREATAGLIQLSQGLASNRLGGDELRSVLEQLPFVADIISQSLVGLNGTLGVTRGEFREMATAGKIGTKVIIEAFEKARVEIEERFARTVPTISQAFSVLNTELLKTTAAFESSTGVTAIFSGLIIDISKNIETLARILGAAGLAGAIFLVKTGLIAINAQLALMRKAILLNPFLKLLSLAATALIIVISLVTAFADKIQLGSDKLSTLADFMQATFEVGKEKLLAFLEPFGSFDEVLSRLGDGFISFKNVVASILDSLVGIVVGTIFGLSEAIKEIPLQLKSDIARIFNALSSSVGTVINGIIKGINLLRTATGSEPIQLIEVPKLEGDLGPRASERLGKKFAEGFKEGFDNSNLFRSIADGLGGAVSSGLDAVAGEGTAIGDRAAAIREMRLGRGIVDRASEANAKKELLNAQADQTPDKTLKETKGPTFGGTISDLNKEIALLKVSTAERELRNAVLKTETDLKRNLTAGEREQLLGTLILKQAEEDRAAITDELNAGTIAQERGLRAVNSLLADNAITEQQAVNIKRELAQLTAEGRFDETIRQLTQEGDLLRLNTKERENRAAVLQQETELQRMLLPDEEKELTNLLEANRLLQIRADVINEILGPEMELNDQITVLNMLIAEGGPNTEQFNMKLQELKTTMEELKQKSDGLGQSFSGGLQEGMETIKLKATDVGGAVSQSLTSAFDNAENALLDFVTTGKVNFEDFTRDIIRNITRILIKQALLSAVTAFSGGPATSAATAFSGGPATSAVAGFANGGNFTVGGSGGTDSKLVQFMATPGERVQVTKPGESGGRPINVTFNITTPDAESFQRNQGQILAKTSSALSRASARNN